MSKRDQLVSSAQAAMKANRFGEAIPLFEQRLMEEPDDLKSLLHLGICHFLNRSEKRFLQIYEPAVALKNRLRAIPDDVLRVFAQYEGLVKKVTAAALVLGAVAVGATACHFNADYSATVYDPFSTEDSAAIADGGDTESDTSVPAVRYSAPAFMSTEIEK